MTTQPLTLELEPRTVIGKQVRQLRRQGITPVHLYGMGIEPLNVQAESAAVQRLAVQAGGNIPISVTVKGHQKHQGGYRSFHLHRSFLKAPL